MASREIVRYKSPARTAFSVLGILFLIIFFVWTVLPLAIMLTSSFKDLLDAFKLPAEGDWGGVGVMFDFKPTGAHYVELFTEKHFGEYMRNSLIASLGSAVVSVFLGSMAAYALSRAEFRGKKDLLFWIISTRMAPVVAVMVPLYVIFRSSGLVGTLPGLILAYTTFNLPFAIWILKGFFDNVPYAIEEAALCDGANRWQALRMIMPLVAPGVGAFIVLCVLFGWNDFLFASIIGAAGVVTTVPMMFLGLLIRRYLVTGLTMGAVRE